MSENKTINDLTLLEAYRFLAQYQERMNQILVDAQQVGSSIEALKKRIGELEAENSEKPE